MVYVLLVYIYISIIYIIDRVIFYLFKKKVKLNDYRDNKWFD